MGRIAFVTRPSCAGGGNGRGASKIAKCERAKREGDGNTEKSRNRHDADKKYRKIPLTERTHIGPDRTGGAKNDCTYQQSDNYRSDPAFREEANQPQIQHKQDSDRQRRGTPAVRDSERRRSYEALADRVFAPWSNRQSEEREGGCRCYKLKSIAVNTLQPRNTSSHAHVFVKADSDSRAYHREPEEKYRRQFVGPNQGSPQHIPRNDPRKQNCNFGKYQTRRDIFQRYPNPPINNHKPLPAAFGRLASGNSYGIGPSHPVRPTCRNIFRATPRPRRL